MSPVPVARLPSVSISNEDDQNDRHTVRGTNCSNHGAIINANSPDCHPRLESTSDINAVVQTPDSPDADYLAPVLVRILGADDGEHAQGGRPALWIRAEDGDEYTGPSSGVSIVSDLGLNWIRNHVPDSDGLCEAIQDIRNTILAQLRQPKCMPHAGSCGPAKGVLPGLKPTSPAVVRRYVDAYFSTIYKRTEHPWKVVTSRRHTVTKAFAISGEPRELVLLGSVQMVLINGASATSPFANHVKIARPDYASGQPRISYMEVYADSASVAKALVT
ncbi:hypothetical protein ACJZ2D_014206 [Fusarium nematophilum]